MIMGNPGIHEYYSSQNGKPSPSAAPMFGWTAAVFIELSIQASNERIAREIAWYLTALT